MQLFDLKFRRRAYLKSLLLTAGRAGGGDVAATMTPSRSW
jgi:hypothetical protein